MCSVFVLENVEFHAELLNVRLPVLILVNSTALTHTHTQSATQIQLEEATPKKSRSNKGVDSGCVSGLDSSGSKKHKHFSAKGDRSPKNAKGGSKTQRQLQHTHTQAQA